MKLFLKHNWAYLLTYLLVLFTAAYYLLQFDKVSIHKTINSIVGNPVADTFFKHITHAGDGIVAVIIALIVILYNTRKGIYVLITYIISGITTNVLKKNIYDVDRPHSVFGYYLPNIKINYIDGIDMLGFRSFPSGHATTAFAVFISLVFITENKILKFVFFLLAFLSAFSRTYLSQHWLVDITIGSIIGTTAAMLFYFIFINTNTLQKLDKPLVKIFKSE